MFSLKRTIAAVIVCFKPHVFLTLCILLVIVHSIIVAIHQGSSNSWRSGNHYDVTLTITTLVLFVALVWAAFFLFMVRFELRNELESLLMLFQCSKRGLRFLGVVGFHVFLLCIVTLAVSIAVEKSMPQADTTQLEAASTGNDSIALKPGAVTPQETVNVFNNHSELGGRLHFVGKSAKLHSYRIASFKETHRRHKHHVDRNYMLAVYKIWLTAIVYAFLYLILENMIMFYSDLSLVEFVHCIFLRMVARTTGIDLSDYSAGEMLFNPLVDRRVR